MKSKISLDDLDKLLAQTKLLAEAADHAAKAPPSPLIRSATNRQKKVLRLFGVKFSEAISFGAAGWEVGRLFAHPENRDTWGKYLYLTKDFDDSSSELRPFDRAALADVIVPADHSSASIEKQIRQEIAAQILASESPFDAPAPTMTLAGRTFIFTGRFVFGKRVDCEEAVRARGGFIPPEDSITQYVDYLVIGTHGNPSWSSKTYGRKIESAVVLRRNYGRPAIISEDHWTLHLGPSAETP